MRTFEEYIKEAIDFRLGGKARNGMQQYNYFLKDGDELYKLIDKLRKERGDEADFNDIDTSKVTDMRWLFNYVKSFNGDISLWDTSNVTDMNCMFENAYSFNQDISGWDTSNVTNMREMFNKAESFNQDISRWDVSKVTDTYNIFNECPIREEFKPKFKK